MLKNIYTKKLIICAITLFTLFLIYIIPEKKEKINFKEELNYVNKDIETSPIFLLDKNNYLASTKIVTTKKDIEGIARELIEALIIDGNMQDNIPSGFKAILPSGTKVLELSFKDNIIKVNFNKEVLDTNKENEERIIESIVYTLTGIDNVKFVTIYIEGDILTKLPQSKITLPSTLTRNIGINKEYNINTQNNITKTTIYYISEYNNQEYYVPVTKVNNDSRNKIEIIIDELSSSNVYKSNLMSYLNNNTKILSVSENNDEIIINFNNAIFNNIDSKEILEEVIYTISLSINDNYNVSSIVFNVENEEIYKSVNKTIE